MAYEYINFDYLNTVGLFILAGLLLLTYTVRFVLKGRARFDRVDRQGGSVLLGKGLMEAAYWSMQPLAKAIAHLHITPNQLSWMSLVLGGLAGTFLAYGYFGACATFATFSAFLDSLDGMVARLTGVASEAGEVLDATIDRYVEFFFLAGAVLYYREVPTLQIMALFALMGSFMVSYSTAKAEALHVPPPPGIMRRPERAFYLTLGAALSALPVAWLETRFDSPIHVGVPFVISVGFIAILSNISAIERLYTVALAVKMRELEEVETAETSEEEEEDAGIVPHHP